MSMSAIGALVTLTGVGMVLLGTFMAWWDWKKRMVGKTEVERNALGDTLKGLTKLLKVLQHYGPGQQLIVFGFLLIVVGAGISGVSGLL